MALGQPGFFTVNPDGTIAFDFQGHVSAQGVELLAGSSVTPPNDRKIRWHLADFLSGATLGQLFTYYTPGTETQLILRSDVVANSEDGFILLTANGGNGQNSFLSIGASHLADALGAVVVGASLQSARILDALNRSTFPKMPAIANVTITAGKSPITVSPAAQSFIFSITHGLGKTPTTVICTEGGDQAAVPPIVYQTYNYNASTFTVRAWSVLGATGATIVPTWIAWG